MRFFCFATVICIIQIFFYLAGTNLWCSGKIYNLSAFILQKIKLSLPIVPHYKCINVILMYIAFLLLPIFLWNNQVDIT